MSCTSLYIYVISNTYVCVCMNVLPCVIIFGQQDKTDGNSAVPSQGRHQSELAGGGGGRNYVEQQDFRVERGRGLKCISSEG